MRLTSSRAIILLGFILQSIFGFGQVTDFPSYIEKEFNFSTGEFQLAGRLLLPDTLARYPVILNIWGSGPTRMEDVIKKSEILSKFAEKGYAILLYDKPGSGASLGTLSEKELLSDRVTIARAALEKLRNTPFIDPERIGLYGSSQASYVMGLLLENPEDLSFVICWSCPMENSIEQTAYQIKQYLLCAEKDEKLAEKAAQCYRNSLLANDYDTYMANAKFLNQIPEIRDELGWGDILPETVWRPISQGSEELLDPASFFGKVGIPILAIYGTLDKNINPHQAVRFLKGLQNENLQTVWIPNADHNMRIGVSGCVQEQINGYREVASARRSMEFEKILTQWLDLLQSWNGN